MGLPGPRLVPYCQVFPSTPQKWNMAAQNTVRFGMHPYRSITHMYTRERNLFSRLTISYDTADFKGI